MVENVFGILVSRFRVLPLGTMVQMQKMLMLHNMLKTHQGGADRAQIPANDVAALQNEQVVYVPDDN